MRRRMSWIVIFVVALALPSEAMARRYGGGGGSRGGGGFRSYGSSRSSSRPSAPRYDERARRVVGQETSRQRFGAYQGLPAGAPRVTPQQLSTRDARERSVVASRQPTGAFPSRPGPVVMYRDPFNSSMLQYMSMMWLFHHWGQVDHRRFDEARVRDLERQVAEMKAKGMQPDPTYAEPGVDPDLVYRRDVLEQPEGSHWGMWFLGFLAVCGAGFALVFVYTKRSQEGRRPQIVRPQEEDGLYNPLRLHTGDFVSFKTLDLAGRNWSVTQVSEYQRLAGDETFPMINYELQDEDRRMILRAVPGAEALPDLLVLKVFDEMGFNEDVVEAVKSNEFYVDEDDGTRTTYSALSDCGEEGWSVRTKAVTGRGQPAKEGECRYWDYYRKGDVSRGEMAEDVFFFVEIDQATGWTRMLEGSRITSGDVETFPA